MPPPDDTTPLMPVARQLNWRQKCYKFFHWPFYFVFFLLLLVDVGGQIFFAVIILCRLFHGPKFFLVSPVLGIVLNIVDTLICWIFLGFVARSPRFVGCVTIVKYLIHLPKFWSLVYRFLLYILGVVLLSFSASQNQEAIMEAVPITENLTEALNVLTKVALVGVLNYVQVRNVAPSRFTCSLLKRTLEIILFSQLCNLIGVIVNFFLSFLLPIATGNSQVQQIDSFFKDVTKLFLLPILTSTAELIFTKRLQDNKCIIGKNENKVSDESNESCSFIRQRNPRDSNAIETII